MDLYQLLDIAITASLFAGKKIRDVYASSYFDVQVKDDMTPVTKADRLAHDEILNILEKTGLPVLSEEGDQISYSERKHWHLFWLVDPLDGTKEFIKRNDEFTVNIALIKDHQPIAGIIYAPVTGELYVGIPETGAWKYVNPTDDFTFHDLKHLGNKLPETSRTNEFVVTVSRSHLNRETEIYLKEIQNKYGLIRVINKGSSLKIAMVAEGSASIYPKFGQTMEWDTAAGHAIVKASGKNIFHSDLKTELNYNKENLLNPHFVVI
jgi:3'(2'), 5'-bisphosphate nucleotidase